MLRYRLKTAIIIIPTTTTTTVITTALIKILKRFIYKKQILTERLTYA